MEKYKEDEGYIKEEAKVCYTLKGVPVIILRLVCGKIACLAELVIQPA